MKFKIKEENGSSFIMYEHAESAGKALTLEDIYLNNKKHFKYTKVAAKIDNVLRPMWWKIEDDCKIEFIDVRNHGGNLIYQSSVVMIFLKAMYDINPDVKIIVDNALNKGLYIKLSKNIDLTENLVEEIKNKMSAIIAEDKTIYKEVNDNKKTYSLDGFCASFCSELVPSTGYIDMFDLEKYEMGLLLKTPDPDNPLEIPHGRDEKHMYMAFKERDKWQKLLGIINAEQLNQRIKAGEYSRLIQLSEALHESKIIEIAKEIIEKKKRIVLIAGPSSSGKTTFAQKLCIQLMVRGIKPVYLGTDDYFINREDTPFDEEGNRDFESLVAVDIDLFNEQMNDLLNGQVVDVPVYDFMKGEKVFGTRLTKLEEGQPIIIEGIHGLNDALTSKIDEKEKYRIYISPLTGLNLDEYNRISTTDERLLRRIVRDNMRRGRSAEETILMWPRVRKGEDKNIFPYDGNVDAFFNSVHTYEIPVLKTYVEPLLEKIDDNSESFDVAQRLLEFLSYFDSYEESYEIPNNSILREFIGESVFV